MKIYTKTGDKGETSLFGGGRVKKNDARVAAYGEVDELNSFVGVLITSIAEADFPQQPNPADALVNFLQTLQNRLFDLGAELAGKRAAAGEVHPHEQVLVEPRFLADLTARGIRIPGTYFDPSQPLQ